MVLDKPLLEASCSHWKHETAFAMAAAYLRGICGNHPFLDGNKRTAVAAALTFLEMNGIEIDADEDAFYLTTTASP